MIMRREIRNEKELATAIEVEDPLCNDYEISCSELLAFSHVNKQ